MAVIAGHDPTLYEALMAEDFPLPADCYDVEIKFPVDGPARITCKCYLAGDLLESVSKALLGVGQKASSTP